MLGSLGAEASKLSNQARFVLEKIEGKITIGENVERIYFFLIFTFYNNIYNFFRLTFWYCYMDTFNLRKSPVLCINHPLHITLRLLTENKSKRELIRMLVQKGFESDPVAAWTKAQEKVPFL